MKKISAIVLAIALVLMMSVPFTASAASTFVAPAVEAEVGATEIAYTVSYEQTDYIANGKVEIEYDAEKLELVIPTKTDRDGNVVDNPDAMGKLPAAVVNAATEGKIIIAFASASPIADTGVVAELVFALKDTAVVGDEIAVKVSTSEWIDDLGDDYAADVAAAEGKIVVTEKATEAPTTTEAAPTTTEAEVTTTEAPATTTAAPTTAAPTTKAPTTAGEATPWALLATVTMAGAALVVLSTKKSK